MSGLFQEDKIPLKYLQTKRAFAPSLEQIPEPVFLFCDLMPGHKKWKYIANLIHKYNESYVVGKLYQDKLLLDVVLIDEPGLVKGMLVYPEVGMDGILSETIESVKSCRNEWRKTRTIGGISCYCYYFISSSVTLVEVPLIRLNKNQLGNDWYTTSVAQL